MMEPLRGAVRLSWGMWRKLKSGTGAFCNQLLVHLVKFLLWGNPEKELEMDRKDFVFFLPPFRLLLAPPLTKPNRC